MEGDTRPLLRLATLFYAAAVIAGLLWAWAFGNLGVVLGVRSPEPVALVHGAWIGLMIVAACHVAYRLSAYVRQASDVITGFLGPITVPEAIYLALLSGFAEELVFRGALWPQLGLAGTSLLFGLVHTVPVRELLAYPFFAAAAGFLFGLLREQTGSVWPCMVAHATVNALNLSFLGSARRAGRDT